MSIGIKYNSIDVLDFIRSLGGKAVTFEINKNIGAQFNNTYQDQGASRYGQKFVYNTLSVKQIPVTIKIEGTLEFFNKVEEQLGGLLNVKSPKELIFDDEPNKIWKAVPSGLPTLVKDYTTSPFTAIVSIIFEIPSSRSEKKDFASVAIDGAGIYGTITKVENGHFKAILNNLGTAEAFPIFNITHRSENGWIGLVNQNGKSYEIGDSTEVDEVPAKKSEILLDFRESKLGDALTTGTQHIGIFNDFTQKLDGVISKKTASNRDHLYLSSSGGSIGNNAGSLSWEIPADTNGVSGGLNDYIWWREIFQLYKSDEFGYMKISVTGENDVFLYGVETFKRAKGVDGEYNVLVMDGKGGYRFLERRKTNLTSDYNKNQFSMLRGNHDLKRRDDRLTFFWSGKYIERIVPNLKGKISKKIHICIGTFNTKKPISSAFFDSFYYRKDFVDYMQDIPNAYPAGSTVEIDMSKGKIYIDGKVSNNEEIGDPEPLMLEVGTNEIDIYFSEFIEVDPDISIYWKEQTT